MKDMVSMEMTKEMKKKMNPEPLKVSEDAGPKYPWGSRLTLEDDHVDSMGMGGAKADDEVEIMAHAKVIGSRSEERGGGKKSKSVELQITAMSVGPMKKKMGSPEKVLYGGKGEKS
jgi:hypothetical protein